MQEQSIDALFRGLSVTSQGIVQPEKQSESTSNIVSTDIVPLADFSLLLPTSKIDLTAEEAAKVKVYQEARIVFGAAGAAPMICAAEKCPFAARCPLMQIKKAPLGELCPFEAHYVTERFRGWVKSLCEESGVTEVERVTISNLVYLDLQELRCLNILSDAQNAKLTSISVKDVGYDGIPVSWEEIIHANVQRLNEITTQRRMIMKDFELTREAQTKKARLAKRNDRSDLSSRQSLAMDTIRRAREVQVIDVVPEKDVVLEKEPDSQEPEKS